LQKRQQSPALNGAEQEAVKNKEAGLPYILADYKAALKKLAEGEKYNRERNKQKRVGWKFAETDANGRLDGRTFRPV